MAFDSLSIVSSNGSLQICGQGYFSKCEFSVQHSLYHHIKRRNQQEKRHKHTKPLLSFFKTLTLSLSLSRRRVRKWRSALSPSSPPTPSPTPLLPPPPAQPSLSSGPTGNPCRPSPSASCDGGPPRRPPPPSPTPKWTGSPTPAPYQTS